MYYTEVEQPESLPIRKWDNWSRWVLFLLVGYSLTARSFSYSESRPPSYSLAT